MKIDRLLFLPLVASIVVATAARWATWSRILVGVLGIAELVAAVLAAVSEVRRGKTSDDQ